jgi:uncharacterized protein YdeI (YjbR/CyaY-like superfamily)
LVEVGLTLDVSTAAAWRAWLEANHAKAPEVWLVYHAKASGLPSLPYNDAVEEALCFGWIDSTVKKLGVDSRAQRFTPRRPASPVSEMNKVRIRRLVEDGRMTPAGIAAAGDVLDEPLEIPPDILARLQADPAVWRNFQTFPESYQRIRIGWIDGARGRPAVFEQRLRYFLRMTAQNKRYGMVQ